MLLIIGKNPLHSIMPNLDSITYRYLIEKAWPIILANAAVPLLGLVDTAVIGNVGTVTDLGAIAFGALIFSFVYWSFGFLRMGTTGSVAQALGAGDQTEIRAVLGRALILAVALGLMLILVQWGIRLVALALLDGSDAVEEVTAQYFSIRIWGAPATLATFALMGVLIGLGNSRQLLLVQLFLNGLNISLDIYFAGVLDWGVEGIALGTIIAEWSTVIFAVWLIMRELNSRRELGSEFWPRSRLLDAAALKKTLAANRDIMIRTLLLVFSFGFFINQSAQFGDVVLAANHILLQLISFAAFFLDGYAFVVESLVGSSLGARRRDSFDIAVKRSSILASGNSHGTGTAASGVWRFGCGCAYRPRARSNSGAGVVVSCGDLHLLFFCRLPVGWCFYRCFVYASDAQCGLSVHRSFPACMVDTDG